MGLGNNKLLFVVNQAIRISKGSFEPSACRESLDRLQLLNN
ncbi:hypothetical protein HMPREF0083_01248 [Aneurinibacillus aneurinilyticus ATCC 12856]|uniref:Uncharacterized protein n=1 Tax=Aneurinibacillus aneurinilyticus ATCC 12856 TaxID=649747 RepID=U1X7Y2_ANEAE|nr:hypothetical protein HMPREF0083_01248 [Aneurinibacillus aneurinilyticus ATCC 12856]